ncbi:Thiamine-monophosphate kinase [Eubacterium plexicaudatum ASF492]|uniref:Selenide, water dikinase n=1 Tax=Eubacterium plexicaudatum ASF492 TaxID=1235802 RepID=N2A1E9_9FIRM|nr:Thiamine-monophosphate kinase [Eubacterium plexicaudatum ASF492]
MKIGKVPEAVLKRSVLNQIHTRRQEVLLGASVGEDCAAVAVAEDEMLVMSTDPITGTVQDIGELAIQITVNDLASAGAEPIGVMLTVLLPEKISEQKMRHMMEQAEAACAKVRIQIMGGHTEVTKAVNQPLISVVGVGKAKKGKIITTSGARPGMDMIITKWIGIEGTAILAKEKETQLLTHFTASFVNEAKAFDRMLSVLPEATIAVNHGVAAMHDVTEGGIFGALWEMAEASDVGLEIDMRKIPVRQETIEICEYFDINPYELISSGSMLMAATDGNSIVRELEKAGIHAVVVGKAREGNDRVLYTAQERRFLEPPKSDELYKVVS